MLSPIEARVLGTLVEKELTTPDQYPLSANGLALGCNQATNREPVMQLTAVEIDDAIRTLKEARLARMVHPTHGRGVTKYRHVAGETLGLEPDELAVLGVLLLRGAQTAGELRLRCERLHPFAAVEEVEGTLARLSAREPSLAVHLDRLPGQKESRWRQLLADEPASAVVPAATPGQAGEWDLRARVHALEARLARVEAALGDLLGPDEPEPGPELDGSTADVGD